MGSSVQKELHSHTEKVFKEGCFARRLHAMEQENGSSAPQQVVNISQIPMEDNKTLKDAYSTTAATILGAFQIIIGVVFFYVVYHMNGAIISSFALLSAFFCISGGIAIGGAQSGNMCLVVATMVMSIIFALSALLLFPLLFMAFVMWLGGSNGPDWLAVLLILLLVIMVIVPTISASLTCKPLCCQERPHEGVIQSNQAHYQPNRVNQANQTNYQPNQVYHQPNQSDQALALNVNVHVQSTSSDMPPATGLTPPPAYEDIVGGPSMADQHQKF